MASDPSSAASSYPPVAFYFKVEIPASLGTGDTSFQEVSGITSEVTTEDVVEGGENRFIHKLPKSMSHGKLELKRGIAALDSPLVVWCQSVMDMDFAVPIVPMNISVYLMNADKAPIRGWSFVSAYPVKWEVESFNSTKNEIAIEKIVLHYNYSNRLI